MKIWMLKSHFMVAFLMTFAVVSAQNFSPDVYQTSGGKLTIQFIGHGTLLFDYNGKVIHIDPWSKLTNYGLLPKADIVLLTHAHADHLDSVALNLIAKTGTQLLLTQECFEKLKRGKIVQNGEVLTVDGIQIEVVPAYNTSVGRERFHPKGVGNGYILTFGDFRVYVAGDTELIPEMSNFSKLNVVFLPMNQPYTMLPEQIVRAVDILKPQILYPYHFGESSTDELIQKMGSNAVTKVIVKPLK